MGLQALPYATKGIRKLTKSDLRKYDFKGYSPNKVPEAYRQEYKDYLKSAKEVMKWKPKTVRVNLKNVDAIKGNKKLAKLLEKSLANSDDILGRTGGIKSTVKIKKMGDLDLYSKNPLKSAKRYSDILKANGIEHYRKGAKIYYSGEKLIEVNPTKLLLNTQQKINSNLKGAQFIVSQRGIKVADPRYLIVRKYMGAFDAAPGRAMARYTKDIPRYIETSRQVLQQQLMEARRGAPFLSQYRQYQVLRAQDLLENYKRLARVDRATKIPYRAFETRPNILRS